jgi:HPt (histidine-containing phosphotransfer) domain-containing protein
MGSEGNGNEQPVIFDREAAMAALDDDIELLGELAELFLADAPDLIEQIRSSVSERNSEQLQRSAHTLKGAASNFRAQATVKAALELEQMGRNESLEGAEQALERLLHEFDRLRPELEKLIPS